MADSTEGQEVTEESEYKLPYVIKLRTPVKLTDEKTISELNFHNELSAQDIENMPASGTMWKMSHFRKPISKMTGESVVVIDKLTAGDYLNCMNSVSHFLADGQDQKPAND